MTKCRGTLNGRVQELPRSGLVPAGNTHCAEQMQKQCSDTFSSPSPLPFVSVYMLLASTAGIH